MSTVMETQTRRERTWVYVTACVLLVGLLVGGLIAFRAAKETRVAREKADELIAALEERGAYTPDRDQIVRVLGDDGGAVCADPNAALNRAILLSQLANGAAGPGSRPIISDSRIVQGQLLVLQIYCPDQVDEYQEFVDDLETDDVAG